MKDKEDKFYIQGKIEDYTKYLILESVELSKYVLPGNKVARSGNKMQN